MSRAIEPRLLTTARDGRRYLTVTVALAALTTGLVLAQATLIAETIARASRGASFEAVRRPLLLLLLVVVARAAVVYGGEVAALRAAAKIKSRLRRRLVTDALGLGPVRLSAHRTGELTTLATRGLDALDPYFSRYLPQLVLAVALPLMVLVRVAWADWPSAVIIVVTLPLIPVFMVLVGSQARERAERQWKTLAGLGGHFLDVVTGLPTLKAFNRAKAQVETIRAITDAHRRQAMASLRIAFLSALVLELLATLAMALVAVEVGVRLLHGGLSYQTALLVLLLTPEAYLPLRQLGSHFHTSMEGVGAAQQAFDVLDEASTTMARPRPLGAAVDASRQVVTFDDVTVAYADRDSPALVHVSLALEPGSHVFLTGPSGAGKSTVLALLLRLVEPTTGRICAGGVPLERLDVDQWRRRIAWLPQHPHLFAASIGDNIALGSPNTSPEDIRRAAHLAGADRFVSALPDGYDTVLAERGVTLSAGERQRIALARVLLRDADVVLLDEPSAGLDADCVDILQDAVRRLMTHRTVVWAGHEETLPIEVDSVVRLHGGRILSPDSGAVMS